MQVDVMSVPEHIISAHELCEKHNDVATASLIENWLDEIERRT